LRLLVLPQAILETLVRHQLTERHARALLRIEKTSDLKKTVRKIVANQLNVKETEALVAELGNLVPEEPVVVRKRIRGLVNYKIYLNTLKQSLETIRSSGGELTYTENYFDDEIEVVIRLKK
jgi:ParB family chromosome partitioning protein